MIDAHNDWERPAKVSAEALRAAESAESLRKDTQLGLYVFGGLGGVVLIAVGWGAIAASRAKPAADAGFQQPSAEATNAPKPGSLDWYRANPEAVQHRQPKLATAPAPTEVEIILAGQDFVRQNVKWPHDASFSWISVGKPIGDGLFYATGTVELKNDLGTTHTYTYKVVMRRRGEFELVGLEFDPPL